MSSRNFLSSLACCLALATACGEKTDAPSPGGDSATVWFEDVTAQRRLAFEHRAEFSGEYKMSEIAGAGLAIFDADGDGRLDVYAIDSGGSPGNGAPNRFFRQLADGTFTDATEESGLGDSGYGMGVAVGDLDNDGDDDVYVANHGRDTLYFNDGRGVFADVTDRAGIAGELWSTSVALFDFDADGFLDIWVTHYLWEDESKKCVIKGRRDYCGPQLFRAQPDSLYRNRGDGTFEDVSVKAGVTQTVAHGLGVVVEDFDKDGDPDVYVANDNDANNLWINQGNGTFVDDAMVNGMALNGMGESEASMGLAVGDLNGDGELDLFSTHFDGQTNTLYLSSSKGTWQDATARVGLAAPSLKMTGFGTEFGDLDNDGDLDIVVVNGRVARATNLGEVSFDTFQRDYAEPNQIFENRDGSFIEVADSSGGFGILVEISRAMSLVDIDGDGGLDIIHTNNNGPIRLHRNVHPARGHWIEVRAVDPALDRIAYGAEVVVHAAGKSWKRTVTAARSYLTSAWIDVHVGLGDAAEFDSIVVKWPGGPEETFPGGKTDRLVIVERGASRK